jgi:hypothetical protein
MDGHQQTIEGLTWWHAIVIDEFSYVGEELVGDLEAAPNGSQATS